MKAKLILIDGLTGAGKSTTAQRLWLHLERHGHAAQWFYEHDTAHPIWPPGEQSRFAEAVALDPSFVNETLPTRWRKLADECSAAAMVTILESTFFQSTVGFLLAMNVAHRVITEHVMAVDEVIAGSRPVLVYFRLRNVAAALQAVFEDRRRDGYAERLIELVGATPYGKGTGLSDFAGLVRFYEHWRALAESLFEQLRMTKLAIEGDCGDWRLRERQLTDFLSLPKMREARTRIEAPSRFIGRYRDAGSGDELVVAGNEKGLYLDDARRTRLIPKQDGAFHIAALCAELSFGDQSGGLFQRIDLRGNLPGLSPVWTRTGDA
jgi:hypothetical protein